MSRTNLIAALANARTVASSWDLRADLVRSVGAPREAVVAILKERAQHKRTVALIEQSISTSVIERLSMHMEGLVDALAEGCAMGLDLRPQTAETLAKVAATDIDRFMPEQSAPEAAAPVPPSMTEEQVVKSWREPRDEQGVAALKEVAEQPARMPEGMFVIKAGNEKDLAEQVSALLQGIFNGRAPGAMH